MSIINEALKKTQAKLEQKSFFQKSTPKIPPKEQAEKNIWVWVITGLIFVTFLACGFGYVFLISERNQTAPSPLPIKEVRRISVAKETKQISNLPSPKSITPTPSAKNPAETLVLNGIIAMEKEQLALINNKIYKVGDYVGDKKIVSISADKVEISDQDKIITLTTK